MTRRPLGDCDQPIRDSLIWACNLFGMGLDQWKPLPTPAFGGKALPCESSGRCRVVRRVETERRGRVLPAGPRRAAALRRRHAVAGMNRRAGSDERVLHCHPAESCRGDAAPWDMTPVLSGRLRGLDKSGDISHHAPHLVPRCGALAATPACENRLFDGAVRGRTSTIRPPGDGARRCGSPVETTEE
jgi:hypothetical protein